VCKASQTSALSGEHFTFVECFFYPVFGRFQLCLGLFALGDVGANNESSAVFQLVVVDLRPAGVTRLNLVGAGSGGE
jgi:hypothetical protein